MVKMGKRSVKTEIKDEPSTKKIKKEIKTEVKTEKPQKLEKKSKTFKKEDKVSKGHSNKSEGPAKKFKSFGKNAPKALPDKPTDWVEFKKKKKEVQSKRKQTKSLYELTMQAKKIAENLRRKTLKGGVEERNRLTTTLHDMLGNQGNYPKFVMTHDMARVVQYLLKFGNAQIRKEIANELVTVIPIMLQSKYAKFCVKRMLKYGDQETRSSIVKACYGHAVKLASHAVSAAVLDYGYTTWATPLQKQHLVQEFFGDMYKQSKDDTVKHLRDVYTKTPDMKNAALGATKANLTRILNKQLLDSHLVQTVLMNYIQECSEEDRTELISQLAPHIVILSNSKEGARVVMTCIWQGSKKDRKIMMKALKEHIISLSKHEHGHCPLIALIDSVDDTVLLNKIILKDIVAQAVDLAADEWGRKVLLSLVAPGDSAHFHPVFIKELNEGRQNSTSKKEVEQRRKEILDYVESALLKQISDEPGKWLSNSSIAVVTSAILKAGTGEDLDKAFESVSALVTTPDWTIKDGDKETLGIEHPGLHMILKKLIRHQDNKFGATLAEKLSEETIKTWIGFNRGCFIFVNIVESCSEDVKGVLKDKLKAHTKMIKKHTAKFTGAKILMEKISE